MKAAAKAAQVPKLRFPGFEGEWWTKPLQALSQKSITYGIVQTGEPVEGGIKCVRVIDLTKAKIDHLALITTTPEISRSYKRTILEEGEIMVALRGDIGLVALVPAELAGANLTRGIARIAPKRSEVTPGFLLWSLRTDHAKTEFNKQVNGSALKEIPINGLNKVEAQLTTLAEQQKIAAFLTAVDGRIEQLIRKKALLEATKKGVMQQLFTQTLRFQDDHGHDFPDWEEKTLGACLTMKATYGIVKAGDFQESGIPMIRGGDIKNGQVNETLPKVTKEIHHQYRRTILQLNDVVIALVGYPGEAAVITETHVGFNISRAVGLIRVGKEVAPTYLTAFLNSPLGRMTVLKPSAGSAQTVVNLDALNKLMIPLPSLPEQTKIAGFLSAMDGKIAAVGEQMRQTQAWKKGLLQQMFV